MMLSTQHLHAYNVAYTQIYTHAQMQILDIKTAANSVPDQCLMKSPKKKVSEHPTSIFIRLL